MLALSVELYKADSGECVPAWGMFRRRIPSQRSAPFLYRHSSVAANSTRKADYPMQKPSSGRRPRSNTAAT